MKFSSPKTKESYQRSFRLSREAVNEETRTVELAFSSEEPYERMFGMEILGHEKQEMDLGRFESGGHPLLLQHDPREQIGVIEKAWLDDKDRKGRALVRFAPETNPTAEIVWKDVLAGIRSLVSVGYQVNEWKRMCDDDEDEDDDKKKKESDGNGKTPSWRAIRWTPLEVSIVRLPQIPRLGSAGRQKKPQRRQ